MPREQGARLDCERFREQLDARRAGRLDAETARAHAAHAAECADCARRASAPGRPPRLIAAGFLGAFAASIFTMIYTGLKVREADSVDAGSQAVESETARGAPAAQGRGDAAAEAASEPVVEAPAEGRETGEAEARRESVP